MLLDLQATFGECDALGAAATDNTYILGNGGAADEIAYDLTANNNNFASGCPLYFISRVTTALAGTTTTATVQVIQSASANLTTPTVIAQNVAIDTGTANIAVGTQLAEIVVPQENLTQRYVGMRVITTGTHTGGIIEGELTLDRPSPQNIGGFPAEDGF